MTNNLGARNSLKIAERSEAKSAKQSFASKIEISALFDSKERFALLASLRSADSRENQITNFLAYHGPFGVNLKRTKKSSNCDCLTLAAKKYEDLSILELHGTKRVGVKNSQLEKGGSWNFVERI